MPDAFTTAAVAEPLPRRLLQETASMFSLFSATVRLHILWLLAGGDLDVGTLAEHTGQSMATVSHHLGKLKLAGLVEARRHGKRQVYVIVDPHIVEIVSIAIDRRLELEQPRQRGRQAIG